MTDAIFSVQKFKADFDQATKGPNSVVLAICAENAFRPQIVDKSRIESAVRDLFRGATSTIPLTTLPIGLPSGVQALAWGIFDSTKQNGFHAKLSAHVDALNAIYAYQRG